MAFDYPDFPEKFDAFRKAIEVASGCPIFWKFQSSEGRHREANRVWGELKPFSILPIGVDWIANVDEGVGDFPRVEVLLGYRRIVFQLNFVSRSQEHITSAWYAAVNAQSRIRFPFINTEFFAPNCMAIETVGQVLDVPDGQIWDDRVEDVALLEITMSTTLEARDAAAVGTWIEVVSITSNLKNPGGVSLDPSLQWGLELMTDGDMEAVGTAAYSSINDAILSKGTTDPFKGLQYLNVAYDGTPNPQARQSNITKIGKRYLFRGAGRGDGTGFPYVQPENLGILWQGEPSTRWLEFSFTFIALGTFIRFVNSISVPGSCDFDDLSLMGDGVICA